MCSDCLFTYTVVNWKEKVYQCGKDYYHHPSFNPQEPHKQTAINHKLVFEAQ